MARRHSRLCIVDWPTYPPSGGALLYGRTALIVRRRAGSGSMSIKSHWGQGDGSDAEELRMISLTEGNDTEHRVGRSLTVSLASSAAEGSSNGTGIL